MAPTLAGRRVDRCRRIDPVTWSGSKVDGASTRLVGRDMQPACFAQQQGIRTKGSGRRADSHRPDVLEVVHGVGEQRTVVLRHLPHERRPVRAVQIVPAEPRRQHGLLLELLLRPLWFTV